MTYIAIEGNVFLSSSEVKSNLTNVLFLQCISEN